MPHAKFYPGVVTAEDTKLRMEPTVAKIILEVLNCVDCWYILDGLFIWLLKCEMKWKDFPILFISLLLYVNIELSYHIQTYLKPTKLHQNQSNISKSYPNLSKTIQTYSNLPKYVQNLSKPQQALSESIQT